VRKFKVTLEGKNLLLDMEGVSKFGVRIVRFVEAVDELLAEHTAREDFRCEPKGKALCESLLNAPDDPPIFETAEVTEVESFDRDAKPPGLIFYPKTGSGNDLRIGFDPFLSAGPGSVPTLTQ
jgi:hypothetical protein